VAQALQHRLRRRRRAQRGHAACHARGEAEPPQRGVHTRGAHGREEVLQVELQQHGLADVRACVVHHGAVGDEGAGRLVHRDAGEQLVEHPALQRPQPGLRHLEQAPAAGALRQEAAGVVLFAQRRLALPVRGQREAPEAGRRDAEVVGEAAGVRPARQAHRREARGRRRLAFDLLQVVPDHARGMPSGQRVAHGRVALYPRGQVVDRGRPRERRQMGRAAPREGRAPGGFGVEAALQAHLDLARRAGSGQHGLRDGEGQVGGDGHRGRRCGAPGAQPAGEATGAVAQRATVPAPCQAIA